MTAKNAPGKHFRKGISLLDAMREFGDDEKANAWFVSQRWPNGIECVQCGSPKVSRRNSARKTPLYHCNACKADFTVKVGTVMESSNIPLSKWAMAFYLMSTNLKGVSSMKLHRDLGITQKSAWFMEHRIRETWNDKATARFVGPVEADETYFGGKEGNKHEAKKLHAGRGSVGKVAVAGVKDRTTGKVKAKVVARTDGPTLRGFVHGATEPTAQVYTDEAAAYEGLRRSHEVVNHSTAEYVKGMAHTNGMESFWASMKRGHDGVYHHFSPKHLDRYVSEFAGRHNARPMDTIEQMAGMALGAEGKRLRYSDLIGPEYTRNPRML